MTNQMVSMGTSIEAINKHTGVMSEDTHKMSGYIKSMNKGIKNVTSPRGVLNMWRR